MIVHPSLSPNNQYGSRDPVFAIRGPLRMAGQNKRRVILLSTQPLLGEALANLLRKVKDVELIGPWSPDSETLTRLPAEAPDVLLLASEENDSDVANSLTAQILSRFPDYPLVQVSIEQSTVRLYTSKTLAASSADLIEAIRSVPKQEPWKFEPDT